MCGVLSIPVGKSVDIFGPQRLIVIGALLMAASVLALSFVYEGISLGLLIPILALAGLGTALLVPSTGAGPLFSVETKRSGAAMGVFLTNGFIAGSLGVALSGLLMSQLSAYQAQKKLVLLNHSLTQKQMVSFNKIASGVQTFQENHALFSANAIKRLQPLAHQIFSHTFQVLMLSCMVLSILAFFLALKLKFQKNV